MKNILLILSLFVITESQFKLYNLSCGGNNYSIISHPKLIQKIDSKSFCNSNPVFGTYSWDGYGFDYMWIDYESLQEKLK